MQQATATEYQTQHNIEWLKGNHTNTANTVDTGVHPQHHHAGEYYHLRRSSDTNYNTYEDNTYGYYTDGEVESDGYKHHDQEVK